MLTPPVSLEQLPSQFEELLFRFEDAWNSGAAPNLPDFCPQPASPAYLLELCRIDVARRHAAGLPIDPESYLAALPELHTHRDIVYRLATTRNQALPGDAAPHGPGINVTTVYEELQAHAKGGLGEIMVAMDRSLRRRVAIKLLQTRWLHSPRARRDFFQEVKVTSRLEHPGIVPVHGLGQTADGRPCYSMRFVEGETLQAAISRFHQQADADEGHRAVVFRGLLSRLVAVCNTLAYAHSHGVLHRDLKPENIMLGPFGETLVLDWGMAKQIQSGLQPHTAESSQTEPGEAATDSAQCEDSSLLTVAFRDRQSPIPTPQANDATLAGELVGTPAYMSPEQATGDIERIGPRTDLFGLGATLYSILTGQPPYQGSHLAEAIIKARSGDYRPPRALMPGTPPPLQAICCKAMAREPEQRYASALDMAGDLENWLAGERVSAWEEPWHVSIRRVVRRRRALVAVITALSVVLPLAAVVGSWFVAQERAQREIARQTAAVKEQTAAQVTDYLKRTFQSANPVGLDAEGFHGPGERTERDTTHRMLDSGLALLRNHLEEQPLVRAELLDAIGNSYRALGLWNEARKVLQEGYALRAAHAGEGAAEMLASQHSLARLAQDEGNYVEAELLYREVIQGRENLKPPQPLLVAETKYHFAWMLFNRPLSLDRPQFDERITAEAEQLLLDVLETRKRLLPLNHRDIGLTWAALAVVKACQSQEFAAKQYAGLALELFRSTDQESMLGSVVLEYIKAERLRYTGHYEEADVLYQKLLTLARKYLGPRHHIVVMHMANMVGMYRAHGDVQRGEPLLREMIDILRTSPPMRSLPVFVDGMLQYGDFLRQRSSKEASAMYAEALQFGRERPKENEKTLQTLEQRLRELETNPMPPG